MAWFHSHHAKVEAPNFDSVEQLFVQMTDNVPKPPRRMRLTQFYSKRYYDSRVKPVFEAEWAIACASGETPKPSRINVLNSVTSRLLENETAGFKDWLTKQRDAEHARELEEHQKVVKEMESAPTTPETYHSYVFINLKPLIQEYELTFIRTLNGAAAYLQPFADLMAKKFGAVVSILMVCPIGANNGEIELRR